MNTVIETIEGEKGLVMDIVVDDPPTMNPRVDFDNLGTMACLHKRYSFGEINTKSEVDTIMSEINDSNAVILPIFMYEHSGIALKTTEFSDPWDSGQLGVIFVRHDDIKKEYGDLSEDTIKTVKRVLESEVEEYSHYVNGEVYGYIIRDQDDVEQDSCFGFFGMKSVEEESKMALKSCEESYEPVMFKSVRP
jgi:hypothetical protein